MSLWGRPWLWLPSQWAHDLSPYLLPLFANLSPLKEKSWQPFRWQNLEFQNPLGIAGGVDKSGQSLGAWAQLGAGFLEVGTVTPQPQGSNPGKIMDRHIGREALWNKMGFPNPGAKQLVRRLEKMGPLEAPLFVNIGKNRWTTNECAVEDYLQCIELLSSWANAFVVNLSSPNTQGLRDLLAEEALKNFLSQLRGRAQRKDRGRPYLLKLSPDMAPESLAATLDVSKKFVDGWILTNTTRWREPGLGFSESEGGLSGRPLKELSLRALKVAQEVRGEARDKLIISVGGVSSAQDVCERLSLGADLVQVYSALVFSGPFFFKRIIKDLQLLESEPSTIHDRAGDL